MGDFLRYHNSFEFQSLRNQNSQIFVIVNMPTQSVLLVKIQSEGVSKASGAIVVSVGNKRESPGVIAVLLCKLLLPSTVAVLPICPCPYLKVFLRVRQSLRVRQLTSLSLSPPSTTHLPILLLISPAFILDPLSTCSHREELFLCCCLPNP